MLESKHLLAGSDKVFLGLEEIRFLGFLIAKGTVGPDPEKTAAIEQLLLPQTRSQVRGFLGITGYYRDFVKGYSKIARPLNDLLKEDCAWEWDSTFDTAFTALKTHLTTSPILALPDLDRPYTLHTDFSHVSVSAILE